MNSVSSWLSSRNSSTLPIFHPECSRLLIAGNLLRSKDFLLDFHISRPAGQSTYQSLNYEIDKKRGNTFAEFNPERLNLLLVVNWQMS